MKPHQPLLYREMNALIERSCLQEPNILPDHHSFHKALLKFFFGAADVSINYNKRCISLFTHATADTMHLSNAQPKDLVVVQVEYTELETALKQCLEEGDKQSRFYKSLLFHYNKVSAPMEIWSA